MATISAVESRIRKIERFDVRILHADGADVSGDRTGIPQYTYDRKLKDSSSVRDWRDGRFHQSYLGFEVEVLDASGRRVHGNTLLGTVRDSYLDD